MQLVTVWEWATQPATNANLKKQLAAAIATAAVQVLAEDYKTWNHANRVTWANTVLATPDAPSEEADQFIWGVLGNVTIQGELETNGTVPDGDLQFTVASLIDTYAP